MGPLPLVSAFLSLCCALHAVDTEPLLGANVSCAVTSPLPRLNTTFKALSVFPKCPLQPLLLPVSTPSWSLSHTHTLSPEHFTCCSLCLEFVPSTNISQVPPPRQAPIRDLILRSTVCFCGGDVCTLWRQRAWGKMWHGLKEECEGTGHKLMGLE